MLARAARCTEQTQTLRAVGGEGRAGARGDGALAARRLCQGWIEGMAVNLGAPALLADPRVRALPKPSFYDTPGVSLWERDARLSVRTIPALYQVLLAVGLVAMLPFLVLEAVGFVMLARASPWAAALRRRRARLFPPAQRAGGDAEIPPARWSRCCSCWRRFRSRGNRRVSARRRTRRLLDALEDADVVGDRGAAHVEDAAELRILRPACRRPCR